jgi:hypothetical protein
MKIVVHIDRLVLDGLATSPAEAALIRTATQAELTRLLATGSVPARLRHGGAVPSVAVPVSDRATTGTPQAIGTHIARAVHGGLGGAE